jgi:acyl-CoA dehydrogenase
MSIIAVVIAAIVLLAVLGFLRVSLEVGSILFVLAALSAAVFFSQSFIWFILVGAIVAVLNVKAWRQNLITARMFTLFKSVTPEMSATEHEAINAGTVWWDRDLFSGNPDFQKLLSFPAPSLSPEETAFLNGPVETLCQMIDDWHITTELKDLPLEVWQYMKTQGFFGITIKKQYSGLGFSNYAHARIVTKIASRGATAAVTVMVPNSLGPGELLQHYGTEAQKNYYLPRLVYGQEIPCFALTGPEAGSDAGAIPDYGVVCEGSYIDPVTHEKHEAVLGIRITWEKRYITLAPVATLLGLAFKLYDPEGLLGDTKELGITCALIPTHYPGVNTGQRHYPANAVFQNGPTWGNNVFIPLEWIIGGREYAGQGWRMLVECLSIGRCISLPAMAVSSGKIAAYATGAYARIRQQFGLSIGRFEGVDEALARIGGYTYQMDAAQCLALTGLDMGEKPSVISGILKYHNTERMRKVLNDAMDVHGGKAVCMGPRNYLARGYQAIPIAITVEGANILTRSMIIFGQGAIRSHPYVLREIQAALDNDLSAFDQTVMQHIGFVLQNTARAFILALTGSRLAFGLHKGVTAKYYQHLSRLSAAFAFLADLGMASLGGSLKFREKLSARLGDMLSNLYIASACLKKFEDDGRPIEDLPLLRWSVEMALYDIQQAMDGFLANLPNRVIGWVARLIVFPLGRRFKAPGDGVGSQVAHALMTPSATRARLIEFLYAPEQKEDVLGILSVTMQAVIKVEELESKLRKAQRQGVLPQFTARERLEAAVLQGLISEEEKIEIIHARHLRREVVMVDEFDPTLKEVDANLMARPAV